MTKTLFFILALVFACENAKAFDGLVTSVHDGDSLRVQGIAQEIRIRYADTPELKAFTWGTQPYGAEARTSLLNLWSGQVATLTKMTLDKRTNRYMANVNCQGFDVATWQIANGAGWAYKYGTPKKYKLMQVEAQTKQLGLWALPNPVDPWAWRKNGMH